MPTTFDLEQLRTLVAISERGGFGRAASSLHVSQPTVSQHVKTLERRLHTRLIVRGAKRTSFTPAGEALLVEARRILAANDDAVERLGLDEAARQPLVIGSTETAVDRLLPQILVALTRAYPKRRLQFHIERSTQLAERIEEGSVDLALLLGFPGDTVGRTIGSLALRWYRKPGWRVSDDSDPVPLIAYFEPCGMRRRAFSVLGDAGRRVRLVAESTSLDGVIAAARAGLGVAVLPTAGACPAGLEPCDSLPSLGTIGVNLAARHGVDPRIHETAAAALQRFFAGLERAGERDLERIPVASLP